MKNNCESFTNATEIKEKTYNFCRKINGSIYVSISINILLHFIAILYLSMSLCKNIAYKKLYELPLIVDQRIKPHERYKDTKNNFYLVWCTSTIIITIFRICMIYAWYNIYEYKIPDSVNKLNTYIWIYFLIDCILNPAIIIAIVKFVRNIYYY